MLSIAIYRNISFLYAFVMLAILAYVRVSLAHLCCKIKSNRLQFLYNCYKNAMINKVLITCEFKFKSACARLI